MGGVVQKMLFKDNSDADPGVLDKPLLGIPLETIDQEQITVGDLCKGKKLTIFVNVASKWAFAHKSYVELVNVYDEYSAYGL